MDFQKLVLSSWVAVLIPNVFAQDVTLTTDGKVPGKPFEALQQQITTLQQQLNTLQRRVAGNCAVGSSIRAINADGTVVCEDDDVGSNESPPSPIQVVHRHIPFPAPNTGAIAETLVEVPSKYRLRASAQMGTAGNCVVVYEGISGETNRLINEIRFLNPNTVVPNSAFIEYLVLEPAQQYPLTIISTSPHLSLVTGIGITEGEILLGDGVAEPATKYSVLVSANHTSGCGFNVRIMSPPTLAP